MEFLILMLLALILVIPLVALILSIENRKRAERMEQRLLQLEIQTAGPKSRPFVPKPVQKPEPELDCLYRCRKRMKHHFRSRRPTGHPSRRHNNRLNRPSRPESRY